MITVEELKRNLSYDPDTGVFMRLPVTGVIGFRSDLVGKTAGSPHNSGYISLQVCGRKYLAHRLAWMYMTGEFPKNFIDHKNGIRTDNRFSNLRDVTRAVNSENRGISNLIGASYHKATGMWRARIGVNGSRVFIGYYDNAVDAHAAYVDAKYKLHKGWVRCGNP